MRLERSSRPDCCRDAARCVSNLKDAQHRLNGDLLRHFALFLMLCLFARAADAQSIESRELRGVVQDSSHAAIAGAAVTLQQGASRRSVISGSDGGFLFTDLSDQPGDLTV